MDRIDSSVQKKRNRTISDLTEEQIQQKRRADREAQRAFRQRTRNRISELERHVVELQESSTQRETQLQHELQTLRSRNKALVRRLSRIAALATKHASPHGENCGFEDRLRVHDDISQSEVVQSATSADAAVISPAVSVASEPESLQHNVEVFNSDQPQSATAQIEISEPVPQPANSYDAPQPYPVDEPDSAFIASDTSMGAQNRPIESSGSTHFPEANLNAADSSPMSPEIATRSNATFRPDPLSALLTPNNRLTIDTSYSVSTRPVFAVLPMHIAPTCPLDQILIGFFISQRDMLSKGIPLETVIGPQRVSVKALIQTELSTSVHPVSKVMSEVMSTYPYIGKVEQLALVYLMHQTMRWQISPTKENYHFMPTWLRPTVTQITVPHAAWIDNVPWPGVRDLLIDRPEDYPYELWTENFTQNVSVNWKFEVSDAVSETDNDIILHSIFQKHIRNLKNWTVSSEFAQLFPNLMPAIYSWG